MSWLSVYSLCAVAAAHKSITAETCLCDIVVSVLLIASEKRRGSHQSEHRVHLEMSPPGTGMFVDHKGVFNLHR